MLLGTLLFDIKKLNFSYIEDLMRDICSWNLCDNFCKNLLLKSVFVDEIIENWYFDDRAYYKRAAFVLMTAKLVKFKEKIDKESVVGYI